MIVLPFAANKRFTCSNRKNLNRKNLSCPTNLYRCDKTLNL